jgi:hypothetical protein
MEVRACSRSRPAEPSNFGYADQWEAAPLDIDAVYAILVLGGV